MTKKTILILITLLFTALASYCQQKSSWQIWVVPNTYTLYEGDTLKIAFGVTGYGKLDPTNLKIVAYSETNTLIKYNDNPGQNNIYAIAPNTKASKDRFTKKDQRADPQQIILESDHNSDFGTLFLVPQASGDRKLTLIATYSPDGDSWYTTSREVNYHVNSFVEEHQTLLTLSTIFIGLLAIPVVGSILDSLKAKLNKPGTSRNSATNKNKK